MHCLVKMRRPAFFKKGFGANHPGANVAAARVGPGLPSASVVNVTQIATVDRALLGPRLGSLSRARLAQVWTGVRLVCEPDEIADE
jgi:mRNA-degrading endonuclease toxin of MazEF toxin-antitoxin module